MVTIWVVGFLFGVLLAFAMHKLDSSAARQTAFFAAAISVFVGFMATRRAAGS